jgi:hypothetical protein
VWGVKLYPPNPSVNYALFREEELHDYLARITSYMEILDCLARSFSELSSGLFYAPPASKRLTGHPFRPISSSLLFGLPPKEHKLSLMDSASNDSRLEAVLLCYSREKRQHQLSGGCESFPSLAYYWIELSWIS